MHEEVGLAGPLDLRIPLLVQLKAHIVDQPVVDLKGSGDLLEDPWWQVCGVLVQPRVAARRVRILGQDAQMKASVIDWEIPDQTDLRLADSHGFGPTSQDGLVVLLPLRKTLSI